LSLYTNKPSSAHCGFSSTRETIEKYIGKNSKDKIEQKWEDYENAPGNETVRLIYAGITTDKKNSIDYLTTESPIFLKFKIFNYRPDLLLNMNIHLFTHNRICVFNTLTKPKKFNHGIVEGMCTIPANFLNNEKYTITFMTHYQDNPGVHVENVLTFEVHDGSKRWSNLDGNVKGVTRPVLDWKLKSS